MYINYSCINKNIIKLVFNAINMLGMKLTQQMNYNLLST